MEQSNKFPKMYNNCEILFLIFTYPLAMEFPEETSPSSTPTTTSGSTSGTGGESNPDTVVVTETSSELDPLKGKRSKELGHERIHGVLVAKREGFSLSANSIGPLWILEINQPGHPRHGQLVRCFEFLGGNIMMGNPGDGATDLWFRVETMHRPDGTPLDVAVEVGTEMA